MKGVDHIRKTFYHRVLLFVLIGIFLLLFSPTVSAQQTTITDAISSGDITTTTASTGWASGHIADMQITSTASSDITLDLDNSGLYGMVLENSDATEQDEVITDTPGVYPSPISTTYTSAGSVTLPPGETVTIPIIGYCLNFDLATPTEGNEFSLTTTSTKTDITQISTVLDTLETYTFPGSYSTSTIQTVTQLAIWTAQPENVNRPLSEYTNRDYIVNDNELSTVRNILDLSGKDTENIATFSTESLTTDGGGFLGYPWGYPWGLPIGQIPCYLFLLLGFPLVLSFLFSRLRRVFRKPKPKAPPSRPDGKKHVRPTGPAAVSKPKSKDCDELIRKCKEARKEAEAAKEAAKSAKEKANDTYFDYEQAGEALGEAEEELSEIRENPPDEGSFVEMDGLRITSADLNLRKEASKDLWSQYRQGDIDAKTLEKRWEELGEHDALKALRKKDQESRTEQAKEAVDKAKEVAMEAKVDAKEAKNAADSAIKNADKAADLVDKLCKAAEDCIKRARAEAARVATKPPAPVTGKADASDEFEGEAEAPEGESEETQETTEETTETTEERDETDKSETLGAAAIVKPETTYFGPRLGEPGLEPTRTRTRPVEPTTEGTTGDIQDKPDSTRTRGKSGDKTRTRGGTTETPPEESVIDTPPTAAVATEDQKAPRCGLDVTKMYLKALNDIASRLRHEYRSAPGGAFTDFWGARAAYGITFLAANGMEMDFYVPTSSGCPTQKCQHTVTLMGECVVSHTLNDLIYGLCAGFFGVPSSIQKAGGHFAEYVSYGSFDPEVSQQIYKAGSELGEMIRDRPIDIGKSDLGVTVMQIDLIKKPDCLPCPNPATGTIDGHDFTKHDWIWP